MFFRCPKTSLFSFAITGSSEFTASSSANIVLRVRYFSKTRQVLVASNAFLGIMVTRRWEESWDSVVPVPVPLSITTALRSVPSRSWLLVGPPRPVKMRTCAQLVRPATMEINAKCKNLDFI